MHRRRGVWTVVSTLLVTLLLVTTGLVAIPAPPAHAATITVTETLDDDPAVDNAECSLREAILAANTDSSVDSCGAGSGADVIDFDIPGTDPGCSSPCTIEPIASLSELPAITQQVTIDGFTQGCPDAIPSLPDPCIGLDGTAISGDGLVLGSGSGGSTVTGLAVFGFSGDGIEVSSNGNTIAANFIGLELDGTTRGDNDLDGVRIDGASSNTIGGTDPGAGNVIGRNNFGVGIRGSGATGNVVEGNTIGLDVGGDLEGNDRSGVLIVGGSSNTIGGADPGARNVISGNGLTGVQIENGAATGNLVEGNTIGLDVAGNAKGNAGGVLLLDATSSTVRDNVISGNAGDGVSISRSADNIVEGNTIGLDAEGNVRSNSQGVNLGDTDSSEIRGNVISGNTANGVQISSSTGNVVEDNIIGLDLDGNVKGNTGNGVRIGAGSSNTIGGTDPGTGNVISGNGSRGVYISSSSDNLVEGNTIGLDASGADKGNGHGVRIEGGASNMIGGTASGAGNVISGNAGDGVEIMNAAATGNVLEGNTIGLDVSGADRGNDGHGVRIRFGASSNTIGGTGAGAANTIAHNGGDGVAVTDDTALNNPIVRNSIFDNAGLGIDLENDGVTDNDADDVDDGDGGNNLQNFPTITSAEPSGGGIDVEGTLDSVPGESFTVEVFSNAVCDGEGSGASAGTHGEGRTFLGSFMTTTDGDGDATFSENVPAAPTGQEEITATATRDSTGDTSEFSECAPLGGAPTPPPTLLVNSTGDTDDDDPGDGFCDTGATVGSDPECTLRAAIQESNALSGDDVVEFDIPAADAGCNSHCTIAPASTLPEISDPVTIDGYTQPGASENTQAVGTDADLRIEIDGQSIGGTPDGIEISAGDSTVRGLVVNGFGEDGFELLGSGGNVIEGNFIGTDVSGTVDLGNGDDGIDFDGTSGLTLIGGPTPAARNVISGNDGDGVDIDSDDNTVQGNLIGVDASGTTELGNSDDGIDVGGAGNLLGGSAGAEGNVISGNGDQGIEIDGSGNTLQGNSILDNGGLGIDLEGGIEDVDGVTANDDQDSDAGPNDLQNFPVLDTALTTGEVSGSLDSEPNRTYTVELFANSACDPSGHGEGERFLDSSDVTTDGTGDAGIDVTVDPAPLEGEFLTATATDPDGNTSEFSECREVTADGPPPPSGPACGDTVAGTVVLTEDLVCSGPGLFVGAPQTRIKLDGHTITGPGGSLGIGVASGVSANNVIVQGPGLIRNFDRGIVLEGARVVARDLVLARSTLQGAVLRGDRAIALNVVSRDNGLEGLILSGAERTRILSSRVQDNGRNGLVGDGVRLTVRHTVANDNDLRGMRVRASDEARIVSNTAARNGHHGIQLLSAAAARISLNTALGNTRLGIVAPTHAGIQGADNTARGNNAGGVQCRPGRLC